MDAFRIHLLRYRGEVVSPLRLPFAAGAAIRGALFGTLRRQFCMAGRGAGCGRPDVVADCPVCFLLAPVDEADRRGRDVPRPYVLRPPLRGPTSYASGQTFEFEMATFGRALSHFPYALLGVEEMGRAGMGETRQGSFRLDEVWAINPVQGRSESVYQRSGDATVRPPNLPISEADVLGAAATLAASGGASSLRLALDSPTRLVEAGKLVKPETFTFRTFFARLLERVTALAGRYGGCPPPADVPQLLSMAAAVQIVERRLAWVEVFRGSARHQRALPMGGLGGDVTIRGELTPFLPWLVWGTLTHVGKDAAMGNGRYRVELEG
ncbi:MAG TPA: CRISPR system precrRNA processing endoribonuclease RAMP protein Cas6 [Chloroflexota bacterium]|nr:CRISPR system precrRNA processing endoribonuclease RAMP protein Cas6 [Chloroflexota bacterium]